MLLGKWPAHAPASVWRSRTTWLQAVGSLLVPRDPRDWVQITGWIARTFPNGAIFLVLLFRFFFCVWYLCIYWCSHGWGWAGVGKATFGMGSFAKLLKHTQPCSLNPELTGMSSRASGFAPGEHLAQPYRCKNHRWPSPCAWYFCESLGSKFQSPHLKQTTLTTEPSISLAPVIWAFKKN